MAKVLGILGGGQLGRMSALAAAQIGVHTIIFCPEKGCPASYVSAGTYFAEYTDQKALKEFAEMVDVISYEFENIPLDTVRYLEQFKPVYPDARALEVSQDRGIEKKFLNDIGIPTTRWMLVNEVSNIEKVAEEWNVDSFILKTCRFGYDGKGQHRYKKGENVDTLWESLGGVPLIAEECVSFEQEISMIIARDKLGQIAVYGPMENEHRDSILHKTSVPVHLSEELEKQAHKDAHLLAEAIDLVGVLALEMFVTQDRRILANEMAPRPHNSGHWTMDACAVSQFENHVRTVCGYTVGGATRHSDAVMRNLIGDEIDEAPKLMEMENTCVHVYGKSEARPGRKMGHVTMLSVKK
jgi:5-(carboxyamino)imidazole ribonucleotide synthase